MAWGDDNRTCALRVVGHGSSVHIEHRVPGGDVNPYLAVAALIAAGLHGIDNELPLEPPCHRERLQSRCCRACRRRSREPPSCSRQHGRPGAFGDDVVDHYANMARVELAAFDSAVTDWERIRGFERL